MTVYRYRKMMYVHVKQKLKFFTLFVNFKSYGLRSSGELGPRSEEPAQSWGGPERELMVGSASV